MSTTDDIKVLVALRMDQAYETLAVSRALLGNDEISGRAIVNRAYYAAFYCVLALLQTTGTTPRKHQGAIASFEIEFVKTDKMPKDMSRIIRDLFRMRMDDDYKILEPVGFDEARLAVEMSERFVGATKEFLTLNGWLEVK
jgi:uncharacterized protein (UPF0332 family)